MTNWTPQPGELVELTDGINKGEWRCEYEGKFAYQKTLLPACNTMAEAWEALKGLPGACQHKTEFDGDAITIPLESGRLTYWCDTRSLNWNPSFGDADSYAARGRDWQKEGAVREWLAGVAAREAEHGE